ncbi:hypothetical protein FGU64_18065 [Mesorhizobium sp. 8]|nr:hypothetical protein FGU64_18065 [Mesorhizobium sp. 8]
MAALDFPFLGNALWVDFLNTQPALPGGGRGDLIDRPEALGRWARATGEIGPHDPFEPDQAEMQETLRFRAVLREGAESLLAGRAPPKTTVSAINEKLARSPVVSTLVEKGAGWELASRFAVGTATVLLGKVAADFAHTLVSGRPDRLRRCEHPGCVMLFIDTSKNGKRRWCSMETCGNREKAASHRARARRSGTPA